MGGILSLPDTFHFEVQEKSFGNGIDAPMSSGCHSYLQIVQYDPVMLPDEVSLQAAMDSLLHMPSVASFDIGARPRLASHPDHRNSPQGIVALSIATSIQSMSFRTTQIVDLLCKVPPVPLRCADTQEATK